jgi:hypothetical protein
MNIMYKVYTAREFFLKDSIQSTTETHGSQTIYENITRLPTLIYTHITYQPKHIELSFC